MNEVFPLYLKLLLFLLCAIWIIMKVTLKKNNYDVSWISGHLSDFSKIWSLAEKTNPFFKKTLYYLLPLAYPIGFVIFALIFFTVIPQRMECQVESEFRNEQWKGVIQNKFVDKQNHNSNVIEISTHNKETKRIGNARVLGNENYSKINIGDSLVKEWGNIFITVFTKENQQYKIEANFDCK